MRGPGCGTRHALGHTAMKNVANRNRFWGRRRMALERETTATIARRACSPWYGLQPCWKLRRGLISQMLRFATIPFIAVGHGEHRARAACNARVMLCTKRAVSYIHGFIRAFLSRLTDCHRCGLCDPDPAPKPIAGRRRGLCDTSRGTCSWTSTSRSPSRRTARTWYGLPSSRVPRAVNCGTCLTLE